MTMNNEPFAIDTNVIVYAHDRKAPAEKRQKAEALIETSWGKAYLTIQILGEVYRVLAENKAVPSEQAYEVVSNFADGFPILESQKRELKAAAFIASQHRTHFGDALIAATCLSHGVRKIITENTKDFSEIPGVVVENPFA